jgi:hypothetical protein
MDMRKWTLLVAMVGVLLATAFASDNEARNTDREDRWNEQRAFFKEHIKPKVDEQRNQLEPSISNEDKKEISRLREEILNQRLIQNEFLHEARASKIKGEEVAEDLVQELKAQRIVIENLHDQAKLIANKYRPEIDDLVAELRGSLRAEREDFLDTRGDKGQRRGRQGYGPRGDARGHGAQGFGRGPGMHQDSPFAQGGPGPERQGSMDVVRFLLWDVNRN